VLNNHPIFGGCLLALAWRAVTAFAGFAFARIASTTRAGLFIFCLCHKKLTIVDYLNLFFLTLYFPVYKYL